MQNEKWGEIAQEDDKPLYDGPSKSQRKRDSQAMQDLGAQLTQLPIDVLKRAGLPDDIMAAIGDFRRMKSFGAQRRQLQFLGKIMRAYNGEAIREAVCRANGTSAMAQSAKRRCERFIALFLESDEAFTDYVKKHPDCDIQRLRQLTRLARKEKEAQQTKKAASRELYQLLYAVELAPVTDFLKQEEDA